MSARLHAHAVMCAPAQGLPRIMQGSAIVAALVCLLVVLFQLNGRIAADPGPLIQGDVAPFEWAGVRARGAHGMRMRRRESGESRVRGAQHVAVAAAAISMESPLLACMGERPAQAGDDSLRKGRSRRALHRSRLGLLTAGYALSAVTWLLLAVTFISEVNCYVPKRTWLLRFPILFIFAGEIAKLRSSLPCWRGCCNLADPCGRSCICGVRLCMSVMHAHRIAAPLPLNRGHDDIMVWETCDACGELSRSVSNIRCCVSRP